MRQKLLAGSFVLLRTKDKGQMKNEKKVVHEAELIGMTPRQRSEALFGDDTRIIGSSSAWKALHPKEYEEARNLKRVRDPRALLKNERARHDAAMSRTYSEQELLARNEWSIERLQSEINITEISKDRAAYCRYNLARSSYGLPGALPIETALQRLEAAKPEEQIPAADTYKIWGTMAEALNLPPGTELDLESFNAAIRATVAIDEAAKARVIKEKAQAILKAEQDEAAETKS
jgi:hypothetical protein